MKKIYDYTMPYKRSKAVTTDKAIEVIDKAWEMNKTEIIRRTRLQASQYDIKMSTKQIYRNFKGAVLSQTSSLYGGTNEVNTVARPALNVNQALEKTFRSTFYTEYGSAGVGNMLNVIKSDQYLYHDFRKAQGWKYKVDAKKIHWDSTYEGYVYNAPNGNKLLIKPNNSPKDEDVQPFTISILEG